MKIVGLTGGPCTGVSTASEILSKKLNIPVLITSEASKEMSKPNSELNLLLATEFGKEVLLSTGALDEKYIRQNIFSDTNKNKKFTQIVLHYFSTWTINKLTNLQDSGYDLVVVESKNIKPESTVKYKDLIVITCSAEVQRRRLSTRYSEESTETVLNNQIPLADIEALGNYIIDTTSIDLEDLEEKLREVIENVKNDEP